MADTEKKSKWGGECQYSRLADTLTTYPPPPPPPVFVFEFSRTSSFINRESHIYTLTWCSTYYSDPRPTGNLTPTLCPEYTQQ